MLKYYLTDIYIIPSILHISTFIYLFVLYMALLFALFCIYRKMRILNYEIVKLQRFIILLFIFGIISTFIGTRLCSMFYEKPESWSLNLFISTFIKGSVLTFHSGYLIGFLFLTLLIRILKYNYFEIYDIVSLYIPVSHAIGRIACLISGCCWGNIVSLNILSYKFRFVNPVPLYSITFNLILFLFLNKIFKLIYETDYKTTYPDVTGLIFTLYLVLYGGFRFIIEFIRMEPLIASGLTQAQIAMICLIISGILIMLIKIVKIYVKRKKRSIKI